MARKPLIVYVSGAPGSGKTTVADTISKMLYIPHVSSDLIHGGVRLTQQSKHDRRKSLHEAFVPMMIEMAKRDISFVVDHVLQKGVSKADIIDKLSPYAQIIYVHVRADKAIDRFYERESTRADHGIVLSRDELAQRRDFHATNLVNTEFSLELNVPTIEVDATEGYSPSVEQIILFIETSYRQ